jgi:hypothetical protein
MHNLIGDARGFIGDDKKGFAAGTDMHLLQAASCQGCGHGDLSLSNRTLDLDAPHLFQRASSALRSTLEVIRYPACLPQIGCDGVQVARLLYAFPWKTRTNAPSKGRGNPAVSPHLELRPISVPPSMLHRKFVSKIKSGYIFPRLF